VWPSAISGLTNQQAQGEQFLHNEVSTMRCRLGLLARTNCAWLAACLRIVRNLPLCPPPHLKPNEREANPAANTTEQESKSKQSLVSSSRSKKIGCVCVSVCAQGKVNYVRCIKLVEAFPYLQWHPQPTLFILIRELELLTPFGMKHQTGNVSAISIPACGSAKTQ
jgi:hypothetical protein